MTLDKLDELITNLVAAATNHEYNDQSIARDALYSAFQRQAKRVERLREFVEELASFRAEDGGECPLCMGEYQYDARKLLDELKDNAGKE